MNSAAYLILVPMLLAPLSLIPGQISKLVPSALYVGFGGFVLFQNVGQVSAPEALFMGGWDAPLGIALKMDSLAILFSAASILTWALIVLHGHVFSREEKNPNLRFFWPLSLMLIGSLQAIFFSQDIFNLYVTLELTTLCAVGLLVLQGGRTVYTAAFNYLVSAYVGSMSYLMGVGILYLEYGMLDLVLLGETAEAGKSLYVALALMIFGLAVKTALFPFHFWLPPAHANAWPPVSAMLSALVVKGSFLIIIRLLLGFYEHVSWPFLNLLGLMGGGAILYGSIHAIFHPDIKGVIAYSTVSQIGFMFLMLPLMDSVPEIALLALVLFTLAHMFAKAGLFLAAGNIIRWHAGKKIDSLKGVSNRSMASMLAVGLTVLSLAGLPISMGFAGKWTFLQAVFESGEWWGILGLLSTFLSIAYLYRIFSAMMERPAAENNKPVAPPDVTRCIAEAIPVILGILAICGGFAGTYIAFVLGGA